MAATEKSGILRGLVRALVRFYYPRIEVTGGELIPRDGPVLLVANHPNSLIDPVLLGITAQRPVTLMAKAPLFDTPVFGGVLRALGMVPAYRGTDDARQVGKNLESLAIAAKQIAAGAAMGIFPEGKSHDASQLAMVRSGAARLAMQAVTLRNAATTGSDLPEHKRRVLVVPVGINYERKERFRTAVWVKVGRPIDATRWLAMHGGDEHIAMRTLTQEIAARLRHCVVHLENAAWESLLDDVEALLPEIPGGRRQALATLHRRKRVADAINHFHRLDPPRAEAAAKRVAEHAAKLEQAGVPPEARIFRLKGWRLALTLARDALAMLFGGVIGAIGILHHVVPYGIVRLIAAKTAGSGRMVVALSRLGLSVPIYAAWYAFVWWRMSLYFLPWVAWMWALTMPFAGMVALAMSRRLRRAVAFWMAEVRLLAAPSRSRALREEDEQIGAMLDAFASEAKLPSSVVPPQPKGVIYRPPWWVGLATGALGLAIVLGFAAWLLRDRPIEFLKQHGPDLQAMAGVEFAQRMAADEKALIAVIGGLSELEQRFRKFEVGLVAGERSYYRPEDDEEIRRMLVNFLAYRTALLRTVWYYQRHADVTDEHARLRSLLLHYTAAAVAYDYAARFVLAFEGAETAIKKLNEAEPRWDLPSGTYDAIRANLAHVSHRQWLENGWRNYHATLPQWSVAGLREGEPHATFHRAIATAGENTARLSERLFRYKVQTAIADLGKFARGGVYRAGAAVSTFLAGVKIREPHEQKGLVTDAQLAGLRPRLRPGDIIIERRNWYLSTAFLPGYWPHAALYVGTADELKALGLEQDPRVAKHLERFAKNDAAGHRHALIEAVSAGVIFSTLEHSIGEADSVAVLRPRLTDEQRKEVIARAFSHVDKPYDFDYDFFSADKLVCTELVYRSCGGLIDLPLVKILGRQTLPALDIVRFWSQPEGAAQLEFVAFLDGDEKTGVCTERDPAALKESIGRPALTWLQ